LRARPLAAGGDLDAPACALPAITGLTHRQPYPDIFAITILKTLIVFALAFATSALSV
jgi:hypothetical protein